MRKSWVKTVIRGILKPLTGREYTPPPSGGITYNRGGADSLPSDTLRIDMRFKHMTKLVRIDIVPIADDFEFRVSPVSVAGARLAPFLSVQAKSLVLDDPVAVADDIEIRVGEAAAVVDPAGIAIP